MTQPSAAAATAPVAAPGVPSLAVPVASALPAPSAPRSKPRDTPRELRRLTTAVITLSLVFGLLGLSLFTLLTWSMQRASGATAQTIRIQQIQTNLQRADANATNAFLVGGLEPADQAALAALNVELVDYTENIELARANNRQGFPIGAQYLRLASSGLRADALPILQNLVDANALRASSQMKVTIAIPIAIIELVLLGGLVWGQVWLAKRFRRRFNVPLAISTGIGVVCIIVTTVLISWSAASLAGVRDGNFADVRAASNARVAANDAKSNESLTLIARGSGGAFQEAWQASADSVAADITRFRDLDSLWQPYVDVHTEIRALDDGGQWDKAVQLATSKSNTTFDAFDQAVARQVDGSGAATTAGLARLMPWMIVGALLAAAAGVTMAALGRRGVQQRLKEYR